MFTFRLEKQICKDTNRTPKLPTAWLHTYPGNCIAWQKPPKAAWAAIRVAMLRVHYPTQRRPPEPLGLPELPLGLLCLVKLAAFWALSALAALAFGLVLFWQPRRPLAAFVELCSYNNQVARLRQNVRIPLRKLNRSTMYRIQSCFKFMLGCCSTLSSYYVHIKFKMGIFLP